MLLPLLLGLQVAASSPGIITGRFDLGDAINRDHCARATSDEIVVCGTNRQADRQRLRPLPAIGPDPLLPAAKLDLGGGVSAAAHGDSASLPGGVTSNRAMITVKVPF